MNEGRIKLLEQFISKEPNDPFNKYALAMEYYDENPMRSSELLEDLLTTHNSYLPSYYKAAHLYWEFDNLSRAKQIFEEGIALAQSLKDEKALNELKVSLQNLLYEMD